MKNCSKKIKYLHHIIFHRAFFFQPFVMDLIMICFCERKLKWVLLPKKHKNVVITLSQPRMIGFIDIVRSLEMKVLPTSVDNVVATLRRDVVATFWQSSANVVTTLQSRYFTKCLKTSFQHFVNFASSNILVFLEKLPLWEQ